MKKAILCASLGWALSLGADTSSGQCQNEKLQLIPSDPWTWNEYGFSVALTEERMIVGSPYNLAGKVYIHDPNDGQELMTFEAPPEAAGYGFGSALAADGDRLLVGSPDGDGIGFYPDYAFVYDMETGQRLSRLEPTTPVLAGGFGYAVDIEGDRAIVGAYLDAGGAAYVFDVATGIQTYELRPPSGATEFGTSVALAGDLAIVGDPEATGTGEHSGLVWVFDLASGGPPTPMIGSDTEKWDRFGFTLAVSDGNLIVGAPQHHHLSTVSGSAYVFDLATLDERHELLALDGATFDDFGRSVAIDGDRCLVGAPDHDHDGQSRTGGAYVYQVSTGWMLEELVPADPESFSDFGEKVALSGKKALVGASNYDWPFRNSGTAYLFVGASSESYGDGHPGTNDHIPQLTSLEDPYLGRFLSLALDNSAGVATTGFLMSGVEAASLSTNRGGTLYLIPLSISAMTIPADGLTLALTVPDDPALCHQTVYTQALQWDDGASHGLSFTPGLMLVLGSY